MMSRNTVLLAVCLLTAPWAAIDAAPQSPSGAAVQTANASTPGEPFLDAAYLLRPGDVIEVKFFYNPDMNETLPVRPDGRISLPLIEDVQAAGRAPADLRHDLMTKYASTLRQPEVAVLVKEFAPRRIYVGGEVRTPRLLQVPGRMTLLQAVFEAGGLMRSAKASDIVVLRYQGTTTPRFMKVNLSPALNSGDPSADIVLEPYDIVWVPKTRIAKADDFMEQYFRQLVPVPLTLGISYVFGGLKP